MAIVDVSDKIAQFAKFKAPDLRCCTLCPSKTWHATHWPIGANSSHMDVIVTLTNDNDNSNTYYGQGALPSASCINYLISPHNNPLK